jgi:hypothetical protein
MKLKLRVVGLDTTVYKVGRDKILAKESAEVVARAFRLCLAHLCKGAQKRVQKLKARVSALPRGRSRRSGIR